MIGLIGLDYRGTNAETRSRLSFSDDRLDAALRALVGDPAIDEAALISTCNRTEVYFSAPDWLAAVESVMRFVRSAFVSGPSKPLTSSFARDTTVRGRDGERRLSGTGVYADEAEEDLPEPVLRALYRYEGVHAATHLFRVAAGLESMVVGEAQILGQVKGALVAAESAPSIGEELRALFTIAIKVGKRARAETEIGRADLSVASLAVQVASEALGGLAGKSALLIGAGRTSHLCAKLLREQSADRLVLANRSTHAAADLAQEVGGEAIALAKVAGAIPNVHLIISATAAPHTVLSAAAVAQGMRERSTPLVIVDLAVPPDVEPEAGLLPAVSLYTLDMLRGIDSSIGVESPVKREAELARVEEIVRDGAHEFVRSRTMRLAVPGISALRRHVDRSGQAEVARALAQLEHLSAADRAIIERFGQRLVDKMFHHLVSRVRSLAEYDEVPPDLTMRVLTRLFADPDDVAGTSGADAGGR